ncbi:MAG: UDP-N-acetylglucosamine--N-acetylmuramyl-(pentapeptide) pyrophosphoryl-undecaprenol N-acetylglucosamine transferase [Leptolyngbya sp. RL_3_1]|nr:UDP-N-acetylglucosamine--N-acetylmuramyl-(pentapeptide) pyrophosphoryl-undecaprenol N-acetylglucosamine transferase [Leptolyngbya sp. RL_3_1]
MTADCPVIGLIEEANRFDQRRLTSPELAAYRWVTSPNLATLPNCLGETPPDALIWVTSTPTTSQVRQAQQRWAAPLLMVLPAAQEDHAPALLRAGAADYLVQEHLTPIRLGTTVQTLLANRRWRANLASQPQPPQPRKFSSPAPARPE